MRTHASSAALPHRSTRRSTRQFRWQIPIVDAERRIVGWTSEDPETLGSTVRHAAAEKIAGGSVTCAYVQISDRAAAERAGAPADWEGPWRCLAIIAERGAEQLRGTGTTLIEVAS